VNQWLNPLKEATGSNLVDVGRAATHTGCRFLRSVTPKPVSCAGGEATRNACGVLVARLQGNSWAPTPSIGDKVNVGTTPRSPFLLHGQCGNGQARCRLMASGWGGGSVVVGGRESRLHGEGTQRVSSDAMAMAGARR